MNNIERDVEKLISYAIEHNIEYYSGEDELPDPATTILNGLFGWYPLNEESGTRHDAYLFENAPGLEEAVNPVGFEVGPGGRNAAVLSGSSLAGGGDEYLYDAAGLSFRATEGDWTYTIFGKLTANVAGQISLGTIAFGFSNNQISWYTTISAPMAPQIRIGVCAGLEETYVSSGTPVAGQWYHIGLRHTLATKTIDVFVNGVLVGSDTYSGDINELPGVSYVLGAVGYGAAQQMVWHDRALTDAEVLWLYNDGDGQELPGLAERFIITVRTTGEDESFTLPFDNDYSYNLTANWGDGSSNVITVWDQAECTHTYAEAGDYDISISGIMGSWRSSLYSEQDKLLELKQWGDTSLESCYRMFQSCSNLAITATDTPNLSQVLSMEGMLSAQYQNPNNIDVSGWDVSNVKYMSEVVYYSTNYYSRVIGLDTWDTHNVTYLDYALGWNYYQTEFGIEDWDTSSLTTMHRMVANSTSWSEDLSGWNYSNVKWMYNAFDDTALSTEDYDALLLSIAAQAPNIQTGVELGANNSTPTIGGVVEDARTLLIETYGWQINDNFPEVTINIGTSGTCYFEAPATDCVNQTTYVASVPENYIVSSYTWSIESGNATIVGGQGTDTVTIESTSGVQEDVALKVVVTDGSLESEATKQITQYHVTDTDYFIMEVEATAPAPMVILLLTPGDYRAKIEWGDAAETFVDEYDHSITHVYSTPGVYQIKISGVFPGFQRAGDVGTGVTNIHITDIVQWGTIRWESMIYAFYKCQNLGEVSATDVPNLSRVTQIYGMFEQCPNVNIDVSGWDVSNISDFGYMFYQCYAFEGTGLDTWDMSSATNIRYMLQACTSLNVDIGGWDTSSVLYMEHVLEGCTEFNQDLSGWNIDSVVLIEYAFRSTLGDWDITEWNMANQTSLRYAFSNMPNFNSSVAGLDVSNVQDFRQVFEYATSFEGNGLSTWDISAGTQFTNFFKNSGVTKANYSACLVAWEALPNTPTGVVLDSGAIKYDSSAVAARASLISSYGWTITDGGLE